MRMSMFEGNMTGITEPEACILLDSLRVLRFE